MKTLRNIVLSFNLLVSILIRRTEHILYMAFDKNARVYNKMYSQDDVLFFDYDVCAYCSRQDECPMLARMFAEGYWKDTHPTPLKKGELHPRDIRNQNLDNHLIQNWDESMRFATQEECWLDDPADESPCSEDFNEGDCRCGGAGACMECNPRMFYDGYIGR